MLMPIGKRLIIDAHLDLAMNAMEWNRDLRLPVSVIREREKNMKDKPDRGNNMVSLRALREGRVGLVVATQIARFVDRDSDLPGWHSPELAWAQTQGQLAYYRAMEDLGEMRAITNLTELENHLSDWNDPGKEPPVGYILSLEGADSLVNISYLEKAYGYGLRALGPAHYGPGRYAWGTGTDGPITPMGLELLREMDALGMILDITHLTDRGFKQAIEIYNGPIWASHHNCRTLVPHQRQLSDEQIKMLIERDAVIGGVLDAWMMVPDWIRGKTTPKEKGVTLEILVDHYDHICQIAGNCNHIAIGSDLDGMFGTEQSPMDMDTIADLQLLSTALSRRGYTDDDIERVYSENWLRFLRRAWK